MSDLFPETQPRRIPITDPGHIIRLGEVHGLLGAVEALEAVPDNKRTPGFAYALALLQVRAAEARAVLVGKNLNFLAKRRT